MHDDVAYPLRLFLRSVLDGGDTLDVFSGKMDTYSSSAAVVSIFLSTILANKFDSRAAA